MSGNQAQQSAADIERQQEEMLRQKYGAIGKKPKQKLMPKEHKFFDSADWALAKQGVRPEQAVTSNLEPKLAPDQATAPRRVSHLGEEEKDDM